MVDLIEFKNQCIKFYLRSKTMLSIIEQYEQNQITGEQAKPQILEIIKDIKTMINQTQGVLTKDKGIIIKMKEKEMNN